MNIIDNINLEWSMFIGTLCIVCVMYIINFKISNKKLLFLGILLTSELIAICFSLIPVESFDLYRYYDEMNYLRNLNYIDSINLIFTKANPIWYLFLRLICLLSEDNRIIFIFTNITIIGIFFWILMNLKNNYNISAKKISLSILLFFSIISYGHIMSGIRNAMAVSIFALGMYYFYFENKKTSILLYVISILIHPMTVILLVLQFVPELLKNITHSKILVFWSLLVIPMIILFNFVPIPLFQLYASKLYIEVTQNFGIDWRIMILEIIQVIFFCFLTIKILRKFKTDRLLLNQNEKKTIYYFYSYSYFLLGSIFFVNIFIRTRFLIAYFIPFLFALDIEENKKDKHYYYFLFFISVAINIYYIYYMLANGKFI